ncbi:MAG: hypothetical protein PVF17_04950 [Ignavibacteria bacterium]|jgi:hypothetical protein
MSKIDQIESALIQINPAKFQKLCDAYLYQLGFDHPISTGSISGKEKIRKGTPDSYITLTNGNYIFVEYTTQVDDLLYKMIKDIKKCVDESITSIPKNKIEKIIYCINSKLIPKENEEFFNACKSFGITIELIDIDKLKLDVYTKFPALGRDFLDLALDTGQIISVEKFIELYQKNKFTTPLDNKFYYRNDEVDNSIKELENKNILLITGKSGFGKTKLAIEIIKQFSSKCQDFKCFCIFNNNLNVYDDLVTFIREGEEYLFLIDDANRMTLQVSHLINFIRSKPNIDVKIIFTVRDYALKDLISEVELQEFGKLKLGPLSNKEIKSILRDEYHLTLQAQERIAYIANGSIRIAMMSVQTALKNNTLADIQDVSQIFDDYFISLNKDLYELGDENILKTLGIISFFNNLTITDDSLFEKIEKAFGLTRNTIWNNLKKLNILEVVDMYENYSVRIGDQILGSYIFYKVFIKDKILTFSNLLVYFFETHSPRIRDSVVPSVNNFSYDFVIKQIKKDIDNHFSNIQNDRDQIINFLEIFWFVSPTFTLEFITKQFINEKDSPDELYNFDETNKSYYKTKNTYLDILKYYQYSNEYDTALDVIFLIFEKRHDYLRQILHLFTEDFCFNRTSHESHYRTQSLLISKVCEKINNGERRYIYTRLLIKISSEYLNIKFHDTWSEDKRTFAFGDFWLIPNEYIKAIRETIWNTLISFENEKFLNLIREVVKNYVNKIKYDYVIEILEFDFPFVEKTIKKFFSSEELADCDLVRDYIDTLENAKISSEKYFVLAKSYSSKLFELKDLFSRTPSRRELEMEFEEYEEYRKNRILNYIKDNKLEDLIILYDKLSGLLKIVDQHEKYQIRQDFNYVLEDIINNNFDESINFLKYIIDEGNSFELQPNYFLTKILNHPTCNPHTIWDIISGKEYILKNEFLTIYFISIPDKYVNKELLESLYNFYSTTTFNYLDIRLDNFIKYEKIDENVYLSIIKILWVKTKNGENIHYYMLFNPYTETIKKLETIFKNEVALLKEIYFYEDQRDPHSDYNASVFKIILTLDREFFIEFLKYKYKGKRYLTGYANNKDVKNLWSTEGYEEILNEVIDYHIMNKLIDFSHYIATFFMVPNKNGFIQRRKDFLISQIKKYSTNIVALNFIFGIISEILSEERYDYIAALISINQDFEIFKSLILESSGYSGEGGSFVPAMKQRKKFWQGLLPLFDGIKFLKHKRFVEENIEYYNKRIKSEEIRDFTDDFLH